MAETCCVTLNILSSVDAQLFLNKYLIILFYINDK